VDPKQNPSPPAPLSTPAPPIPAKLHLDRQKQLEVTWASGEHSVYTLTFLRSNCPCASCRKFREEQLERKSRLTLLPGNYAGNISATKAEMVGNYALRIEWSDGHASGIYSFEHLWGIRPGRGGSEPEEAVRQ
jgi:DUF971 family protein